MSVLIIIAGILLIGFGIVCFATPLATTLMLMHFAMILMFAAGVFYLIKCIAYKRFGLDLVFAIVSLIAGGLIVFNPYLNLLTEIMILYILAGWMILRGIIDLVVAFQARKAVGTGAFILALLLALIVIVAGVYAYFNPALFAITLGYLSACYFIITGVDLICAALIGKQIAKDLN